MSKVDAIMERMNLADKLRQLTQVNAVVLDAHSKAELTGAAGKVKLTAQDVWGIGSTLNFTYRGDAEKIQTYYMKNSENQIPLMFMADVIHGYRTIFPIPLAMGCSFDIQLAEDCAQMSAVLVTKTTPITSAMLLQKPQRQT